LGREITLPYDNILSGSKPKISDPALISQTLPENLQEILQYVKQNIISAHERNKKYYDAKHRHVEYLPGQLVLLKTHFLSKKDEKFTKKLAPKWSGPYTIHEQVSEVTYSLMEGNRQLSAVYHVLQLKPYYQRTTDTFVPPVQNNSNDIQDLPKRERKPPGFYKDLARGKVQLRSTSTTQGTSNLTRNYNKDKYEITQVTNTLFVSGIHAITEERLRELGITAIINVTTRVPKWDIPGIKSYKFPVKDHPKADLSVYFDSAADLIRRERANGGKTLVHCHAGISRSPSICIAYMIKYKRKRLMKAYRHIRERRSIINPNPGFLSQLVHFQDYLIQSSRGNG